MEDGIEITYDENGHVDGTTADDGQTENELITPEDNNIEIITIPVAAGEEQPSVRPTDVKIIDEPSAAEQPEAWIVHNEDDGTDTLLVDPAKPVDSVSKIEVIEVPDNLPRVRVDDVEAKIVVEIGGESDEAEIIHVKDPETGDITTDVITTDEDGNEVVNEITEQEKDDDQSQEDEEQQ